MPSTCLEVIEKGRAKIGQTIALVSYCFHELIVILVRGLMRRHSKITVRANVPLQWRTMSDDLTKPASLLVLTVLGPRWNCHALLATLPAIPVRETLSIDLTGLGDGSESWSLVLYDERMTTRKWIGSAAANDSAVKWMLSPGRYLLSLRYYTDADDLRIPAVSVDDRIFVSGGVITGESTRYRERLESIRNRSSLYYRLLHYYVFFYLKHGTKNTDWLRAHFLPVGNPDTEWYYGHLAAGEHLAVRFDSVHERAYHTYVAFYNWASFPVDWTKIRGLEWQSVAFAEDVGYAIRCVRKMSDRKTQHSDGVFEAQVHCQSAFNFDAPYCLTKHCY
jgi:hypothetical protein